MQHKIGGELQRPRVALLGHFEELETDEFRETFPTVWEGTNLALLESKIDPIEIDLLVVGGGVEELKNWGDTCHVICFSSRIQSLPGPYSDIRICKTGESTTHEFELPKLPLPFDRLRDDDMKQVTSVRFWKRLGCCPQDIRFQAPLLAAAITGKATEEVDRYERRRERTTDLLREGAIVIERVTGEILASRFLREGSGLGVAWLPNECFHRTMWVKELAATWAAHDRLRLPGLLAWQGDSQWMTAEEKRLLAAIGNTLARRDRVLARYEQKLRKLEKQREAAEASANDGPRRLITAQGSELVHEVANALEYLGFATKDVDSRLEKDKPKREDIRITDPLSSSPWEGIAEIRGYGRSSGKQSDLQRLGRFAELYQLEKGSPPSKRYYFVNGQIDLTPERREAPLGSCPEDVEVFAHSEGLVVWTLDLFKAVVNADPQQRDEIKASLRDSVGLWQPPTQIETG